MSSSPRMILMRMLLLWHFLMNWWNALPHIQLRWLEKLHPKCKSTMGQHSNWNACHISTLLASRNVALRICILLCWGIHRLRAALSRSQPTGIGSGTMVSLESLEVVCGNNHSLQVDIPSTLPLVSGYFVENTLYFTCWLSIRLVGPLCVAWIVASTFYIYIETYTQMYEPISLWNIAHIAAFFCCFHFS